MTIGAWMLAASLSAFAQDDAPTSDPHPRLRQAWSRLIEGWKSISELKAEMSGKDAARPAAGQEILLPDSFLKTVGVVSGALEAAGLMERDLPPELEAFKNAYKSRLSTLARLHSLATYVPKTHEEWNRYQQEYYATLQEMQREFSEAQSDYSARMSGREPPPRRKDRNPITDLEEAAFFLKDLREKKAEEDLVADAVARLRQSLRDQKLMDNGTPAWMRRWLTDALKALAMGDPLPPPERASTDIRERVEGLLKALAEGDIAERDGAVVELSRIAGACLVRLRRALESAPTEEVRLRLRKALGYRDAKKDGTAPDPAEEPMQIWKQR